MKRQRGRNRRNNNNNNHNNSNRSMDSNGPDVKVRGNATQIHDKYEALARDAASSGNRVKAENYRQHAEHYLRLMNKQEAAKQAAIAAREEAEAARAEQRKQDGDDNTNDGEERKGRRYPPRVRQQRDKKEEADSNENSGLEVVTPEPDAKDEATATEDKPEKSAPRRRKAPARKKSDDDTVTEAAE